MAVFVFSDLELISERYELLYMEVKTEYNRIPYAELKFADGNTASQKYPLSESDSFAPGRDIEIKVHNSNTSSNQRAITIFKGIVMKQSLQITDRGSTLLVEMNDVAMRLTMGRKSKLYENCCDHNIFSKILSENQLKLQTDLTTLHHNEMVQYDATDWDFILCRAEANGMLVSVKEGAVTVKKPSFAGAAKRTFRLGIDEIIEC